MSFDLGPHAIEKRPGPAAMLDGPWCPAPPNTPGISKPGPGVQLYSKSLTWWLDSVFFSK